MDFNSLIQFEDVTDQFDPAEIEDCKTLAILAYIIPILFFLPSSSKANSQYAKFVSNQVLTLLLFGIVGSIATLIIGLIPVIGTLIRVLFYLVYWALAIIAAVDSNSGKARKLPVVGKFIIEAFK